ncbi:MAG: glycosyltransferase family 2 protein [Polycyclovorans sp.]|mgnify:FL=1|jgi:polyisoprenyl-phosphate glycosyltransferase|nr:glycosyl transferase family 2 [Polycyclovorans sp.]MBU0789909.1 glycosyltransferase family 2 protein [Gammaproteobacteria bacterium]MDP1544078.1 glycosyltransferase family 2 protein [Polycyclovorans sp.]MEC8848337.1 glycosyltransferase family 2 protein [Pseudomonadota bacterium]|tara:strand:- start:1228 stop:2253 length:1026 start_codon:yes stop_codon:yes gene_type:complete
MRPLQRLTVIVPVFNEAAGLPAFWARISAVLDTLADTVTGELLFIDDGSRDDSLAVIQALAMRDARVGYLALSRNFGKEIAMSAGLDFADGDWVVLIDADLQDPPELIPTLLAKAREGFDTVYARRAARLGEGLTKRATASVFYRLMGRLSRRVEIPADTGDYRVISRRAVLALRQIKERNRFMKGLFAWIGFPSAAVTYVRDPRSEGVSSFSLWRLWNFALDGITSFSTAPLKLATYAGMLVAMLAFVAGGFIILKTLIYGDPVPGFPTLMVTLLFFSGLQLLFIGVIGEYLARLFDEAKQRPLYLLKDQKVAGVRQPTTTAAPAVTQSRSTVAPTTQDF